MMYRREIPWGVRGDPHQIAWGRVRFLEYKLLLHTDEKFDELFAEAVKNAPDEPIRTGDPYIDKLEKELHAALKRGKGVPDGF